MADDIVKKLNVTSLSAQTPTTTVPTTQTPVTSGEIEAQLDQEDGPFEDVKREMRARYELSPEDIQKLIVDDSFQDTLFNIAKETKLTYDELGTLELETTMVLLGLTKESEFQDELQFELRKNDPEIIPVVKLVTERVFSKVRASLDHVGSVRKNPEEFIPESIVTGRVDTPKAAPVIPVTPAVVTPPKPVQAPVVTTIPVKPFIAPVVSNTLSSSEKAVLEKTGVILSDTPKLQTTPQTPTENLNRDDLLASIENPAKSRPVTIMASKLNTTGPVIAPKTTDYSLPKVNQTPVTPSAPQVGPRASDPYREPIN